jgi:hypothetical protein
MHPFILQQVAAGHIKDQLTAAVWDAIERRRAAQAG